MTQSITIGEKEYPVKWNTRAKIAWERKMGVAWADLHAKVIGFNDDKSPIIKAGITSTKAMDMQFCYEVLKQGHRLEKKTFALTIEDIYDLNDEYNLDELFPPVIFPPAEVEEEKKQTAEKEKA